MASPLWQAILTLFLYFLATVNAGHPTWETSRVVHPQWLAMEMYPQGIRLWPDRKIRYAFTDDVARRALARITRQAHELWLAAGLPDSFQIEEISPAECERTRETCLKIERPEVPMLDTPVGLMRSPREGDRGFRSAHWSESNRIGVLEAVPNIAHELGHAWGLMHEMQHRLYWFDEGGYNPDKIFEYRCENIVNFNEVTEHLSYEQIWDEVDGICTDARMASIYGFGGSQWEPYTGYMLQYSSHSTFPTIHDVDWDSIMMYPSYVGGRGHGDDHDFSTAVILKSASILPEDRWMKRNFVPSALDVEGLKILYGHKWPVPAPTLHGDHNSPLNAAFKQVAPGCSTS